MKQIVYNRELTLQEARKLARNSSGKLMVEDVIDLGKKKRSVKVAQKEARSSAIRGFNPFAYLEKTWLKAKKAAKNAVNLELRKMKKEDDRITFSANCFQGGVFYSPPNGVIEFGIHIYMKAKKGFLARLFTGSFIKGWGELGVNAMRALVSTFADDEIAKQVSKETVFNAVGEGENEGKVSYFCCLKVRQPKESAG